MEEGPCASRASPQAEAPVPLSTAVWSRSTLGGLAADSSQLGGRVSPSALEAGFSESQNRAGLGVQTPPFRWGRPAHGFAGAQGRRVPAPRGPRRPGEGGPAQGAASWRLRGPRRRRHPPARVQSAQEPAVGIPPQPPVPERQILKPQPRRSLWPDLEDLSLMPAVPKFLAYPRVRV